MCEITPLCGDTKRGLFFSWMKYGEILKRGSRYFDKVGDLRIVRRGWFSTGSRMQGAPLSPRFVQNHAVFRQFLRENPLFWANFGLRAHLGAKLLGPLTKILNPRLWFDLSNQKFETFCSFRCFGSRHLKPHSFQMCLNWNWPLSEVVSKPHLNPCIHDLKFT